MGTKSNHWQAVKAAWVVELGMSFATAKDSGVGGGEGGGEVVPREDSSDKIR